MANPWLSWWVKIITPEKYSALMGQGLGEVLRSLEMDLSKTAQSLDSQRAKLSRLRDRYADLGKSERARIEASANAERQRVANAFDKRWLNVGMAKYTKSSYYGPTQSEPSDLVRYLATRRMPFRKSKRSEFWTHESVFVSRKIAKIDTRERDRLSSLQTQVLQHQQSLSATIANEYRDYMGAWQRAFPAKIKKPAVMPPALIQGIADKDKDLSRTIPGEGPLVIQVGRLAWSVSATYPDGALAQAYTPSAFMGLSQTTRQAFGNPVRVPVLVDFVRSGGFATTDQASVESAIARLLGLIPAGQLRVHLFDPSRVGGSLKFLSDLSDKARAVVADVRVVAADLEPMLDDLIRHIARVTQQYLGSRHTNLAEYNRSAGEVAEGYHVLVLTDIETVRLDDDVMRKLSTLISAGPPAGVFTIVCSAQASTLSFGLPVLTPQPWADGVQKLMGSALPVPKPVPNNVTLDDVTAKGWRRFTALQPTWAWEGSTWDPSSSAEVKTLIERLDHEITNAKPRSVTPQMVSGRLQGLTQRGPFANPDDPGTWWHKSAARGLEAVIGVTGDREVASVVLESAGSETGILIGGGPGTGKSVLLHALICDLVRNYSPRDMQLYLLDPKQGVEFTVYANGKLPHAKVVTIKAPPESTIHMLENLITQIEYRGEAFRNARTASGASPTKLDDYLAIPRVKPFSRIVTFIDEFQALLNTGDDVVSMRASGLLDRVIREGRAFGIHLVLATQTLQGIHHLPPAVQNLMSTKIALRVSEDDSRFFLGPHDTDAASLPKGGAAYVKPAGVEKRQLQVTNEDGDSVHNTTVAAAAKVKRNKGPTVLDFSSVRPPSALTTKADTPTGLRLLVARGIGVQESLYVPLPVADEGNLLVVAGPSRGRAAGASIGIVSAMLATCAVSQVPFDVIDFGAMRTPFELALGKIQAAIANPQRRFGRRNMFDRYVEESLKLVNRPGPLTSTRRVLFLLNTHRNRDLIDGGASSDALAELLAVAGSHRVHVVLHADSGAAATRITGHNGMLHSFGARVLSRLDSDSSYMLVGGNEAERLEAGHLLTWDLEGSRQTGVPFASIPDQGWARMP